MELLQTKSTAARFPTKAIPIKTVSALMLACIDIEKILLAGELTPDILAELEYLSPELASFVDSY